MIRYDMHMHSSFSTDSDTPMQEMAMAASGRKLAGICFTEHMDLDYPPCYFPEQAQAFEANPDEVLREICRLRQYFAQMNPASPFRIGFGLEFGMQQHLAGRFHEIAESYPLDFIIASQHLVDSLDPYYPESWKDTDPDILIGHYYSEMLSNLKNMQDWDSLAHMDYIIRYIPGRENHIYDSMLRHKEVIDEILLHVIRSGKCLEVNTSGYKYGLGQPNPSPSVLKRYRDLGGRLITIGADAHEPEHIAYAFDKACRLLRSLGYESYVIFENRRMREIQL